MNAFKESAEFLLIQIASDKANMWYLIDAHWLSVHCYYHFCQTVKVSESGVSRLSVMVGHNIISKTHTF